MLDTINDYHINYLFGLNSVLFLFLIFKKIYISFDYHQNTLSGFGIFKLIPSMLLSDVIIFIKKNKLKHLFFFVQLISLNFIFIYRQNASIDLKYILIFLIVYILITIMITTIYGRDINLIVDDGLYSTPFYVVHFLPSLLYLVVSLSNDYFLKMSHLKNVTDVFFIVWPIFVLFNILSLYRKNKNNIDTNTFFTITILFVVFQGIVIKEHIYILSILFLSYILVSLVLNFVLIRKLQNLLEKISRYFYFVFFFSIFFMMILYLGDR